jgi:hypothetical protein
VCEGAILKRLAAGKRVGREVLCDMIVQRVWAILCQHSSSFLDVPNLASEVSKRPEDY